MIHIMWEILGVLIELALAAIAWWAAWRFFTRRPEPATPDDATGALLWDVLADAREITRQSAEDA